MQIVFPSLLILFASTAVAWAQPRPKSYATPEYKIATADHVAIATLDQVVTTASDGEAIETRYDLALKIKEVIKGDLPKRVGNLKPYLTTVFVGPNDRFTQWKEAGTELLCFISDGEDLEALRSWDFHRLGKPVPAENGFVKYPFTPTFNQNLAVLKTQEQFLARAREYARSNEPLLSDQAGMSIGLPYQACDEIRLGNWDSVILPIDKSLENLGHRLISKPEQFIKQTSPPNLDPRFQLRLSGIKCLRFFKSKDNIALLEKVTNETPAASTPKPPLRLKALEQLIDWGAVKTLPKFASSIEELELFDANAVTKESFQLIGQMTNLKRLNLPDAKISAAALKKLGNLKNLSFLELSEINLNDENVQTLRQIGKLHTISKAKSKGDGERPSAIEDVHGLSLWNCPLTDQGIQQFADFRNVEYLDLRNTKVGAVGLDALSQVGVKHLHLEETGLTDADMKSVAQFKSLRGLGISGLAVTDKGLKHLTALEQLEYIRLDGTQVTEAGIADFKQALPKCKIVEPLEP